MILTLRATCLVGLILSTFCVRAQSPSHLSEKDTGRVRTIVREEIQRQADLDRATKGQTLPQQVQVHFDKAESDSTASKLWLPFLASLLTSLLALGGVLLSSRNTVRTTLATNEAVLTLQNKLKYAELVIDALKFFGSSQGTQSRGVGLAVIRANIDNEDFKTYRLTWCAVLETQALYLLTDSKEKNRPDEIANLSSIVSLMHRLKDTNFDFGPVKNAELTNASRGANGPGLDLTGPDGHTVAASIKAL